MKSNKTGIKTYRYWLIVAAYCGLSASSIGVCMNSMGVFFTPVSEALRLGEARSLFMQHYLLLAVGFGKSAYSHSYEKNTVKIHDYWNTIGGSFHLLMSISQNIWIFYILGALRGIGCAFFSILPITVIIGNWFVKKHGLVMELLFHLVD